MKRPMSVAALLIASIAQGCASSPQNVPAGVASVPTSALSSHAPPRAMPVAHVTEVPVEKNAPPAQGHPLTSVVVTQCNLIVAIYMTMADGRLLRFDHTTDVPAEQLLTMAYTATRSERVEVSCNDEGVVGYEPHDPV
jgi:hypothetical protein